MSIVGFWAADEDDYYLVEFEDEVHLTELKVHRPTHEQEIVAALQEVDDPVVLRTLAKEVKKRRAI
eukprot:3567531-Prorocentrum_lima.AAC.1